LSAVIGASAAVLALAMSLSGAARAQEPIKLGVLNNIQGAFADLGGKGSVVAAQMAFDDFGGKVLGRPITIISAGSRTSPTTRPASPGSGSTWRTCRRLSIRCRRTPP
jgi:branched-chain amino acid transport system substrate-binding protein